MKALLREMNDALQQEDGLDEFWGKPKAKGNVKCPSPGGKSYDDLSPAEKEKVRVCRAHHRTTSGGAKPSFSFTHGGGKVKI